MIDDESVRDETNKRYHRNHQQDRDLGRRPWPVVAPKTDWEDEACYGTSEEDTAIPIDPPQSLESVVEEGANLGGGRMIAPRITKEEEEDDERESDDREVDPETPTPSELFGEDCWRKEVSLLV